MDFKTFKLILFLAILTYSAQSKPHISEYFKQIQSECRPKCFASLDSLDPEFNGNPENCVSKCINLECYNQIIAPNPQPQNEKNAHTLREFKECLIKYALDLGYSNDPKDRLNAPQEQTDKLKKKQEFEKRRLEKEAIRDSKKKDFDILSKKKELLEKLKAQKEKERK